MGLKTNVLWYLTLVLMISVYAIKGESVNFESWKTQYLNSHICKSQVNQCKVQLTQGEDRAKDAKFNSNIKESVKIVHLYTHDNPPFYKSLNKNCNSGEKLYSDYKFLLTKAIDTIRLYDSSKWRQGVTTYRGVGGSAYQQLEARIQGENWNLEGFTSSSLDPRVAIEFANGGALLEITNVEGLYVESYSYIKKEEEVLIKRPSSYRIEVKLTDANQIKTKMHSLGIVNDYPKMFVKLRMIRAGKRRRRSTSTYTSCDFTSSSDGVVVSLKFSAFISVLLALVL